MLIAFILKFYVYEMNICVYKINDSVIKYKKIYIYIYIYIYI